MSGAVPPQVIPRPTDWKPGGPPPWAEVSLFERTGMSVDRVLGALGELGHLGPVPGDIGTDRVLSRHPDEVGRLPARPVNAAVLAALFEEGGEARLILTRRSSAMRTHRGEVSFPGGRLLDGEDPATAARREAHEEIALDPGSVTTVGWIHPVMTVASASLIVPVVATLRTRPFLVPSPREVERIFDVSVAELADPGVFHEERWRVAGRGSVGVGESFPVWFFEVSGEMIWGATARILYELLSIVLTGRHAAD